MRNGRWICLALLAAALWAPARAQAGQIVAVLAFGGDDDGNVRGAVVDPLFNRYQIIHGDKVLDACDELGIPMSRGRNLARCAKKVSATAVVGGAVQGGKLSLVVFSGKNGNVLAKGSVPCRRRLSSRNLRKALSIVLKGLRKAPKRVGRRKPREKPPAGDFSFDPEPVGRGGGGDPPAEDPPEGQTEDLDEDPLTGAGTPSFDPDGDEPGAPGAPGSPDPGDDYSKEKKKKEGDDDWPKFDITIGLGTWIRAFGLNDPAPTKVTNPSGQQEPIGHPQYNSGGTFALRLGAKVRPLAFLSDGLMKMLYLRFHFMTTVGLQSKALGTAKDPKTGKTVPVTKLLGTSFWEFMFDLGLDWNILDTPTSPHLVGGLGFGTFNFSIGWEDEVTSVYKTKGRLPDVGYRYVLIKLGVYWPFLAVMDDDLRIGAHFNFDGRPVVAEAGEVEDPTYWYGPASVAGIALGLGVDAKYAISDSINIVAGVEYTYTRYFYTFTDAQSRVKLNTRAAGGALDELHGIMINVGYAY